jgi:hypothetical protein
MPGFGYGVGIAVYMVGSDVIVILYRGSQKGFTLGSHLWVNVVAVNSLTRTLRYYFPTLDKSSQTLFTNDHAYMT